MEAGRCLVSAAERNEMVLVSTVLNSPAMYEFSSKLLDDTFSAYELKKILATSDIFQLECEPSCRCAARKDIYYPLLKEEIELLHYEVIQEKKPHRKDENGEIVGQIQIYLSKQLLFSENLYKL
jgi:D-alanyl-D-alanine carboxypeptidase